MSDNKLHLGEPRPFGETTCAFGLTGPGCDEPATRHFLWINDNTTSPACDEHAAYIHGKDTTETPYDEHAFGGDCNMPGVMWHIPYDDEPEGYCYFPAPDDTSAVEHADAPARTDLETKIRSL